MPILDVKSNVTGRTHTIEFDGDPTDDVIQQAVAQADQPFIAPIREQEQLRQKIISDIQKPLYQRFLDIPGQAIDIGKSLLETGRGAISGIPSIIGRRTAEGDPLKILGDISESAQEGLIRGAADIATLPAMLLKPPPLSIQGIIESELRKRLPPAALEREIEKEMQSRQFQSELQKERERGFTRRFAEAAEAATGIPLPVPVNIETGLAEGVATFGDIEALPALAVGKVTGKAAIKKLNQLEKSVTSPVKTLENLGLRADINSLGSDFIRPATEGAKREFTRVAESGDLAKTFQSVRQAGKYDDVREFIERGEQRLEQIGSKIEPFIKKNEDIQVDGSTASQRMLRTIEDDPFLIERNPEIVEQVRKNAEAINRPLSLREVFDRLKAINGRHENYFKKSAVAQNTALDDAVFAADDAMRRELSVTSDNLIRSLTGVNDNFFREYGSVSGVLGDAKKRYADLFVKRGQEVSKGIYGEFINKFDISKPLSSLQQPVDFIKGGELGRINSVVKKISDRVPKKLEPSTFVPQPPPIPPTPSIEALNQRIREAVEASQTGEQFLP